MSAKDRIKELLEQEERGLGFIEVELGFWEKSKHIFGKEKIEKELERWNKRKEIAEKDIEDYKRILEVFSKEDLCILGTIKK